MNNENINEDENKFVCQCCNRTLSIDLQGSYIECENGHVCTSCEDNYHECNFCNEMIHRNNLNRVDGELICDSYHNDETATYCECDTTHLTVNMDYNEDSCDYTCNDCQNALNLRSLELQLTPTQDNQFYGFNFGELVARIESISRNHINRKPDIKSRFLCCKQTGKVIKSRRMFSCEIETYYPTTKALAEVSVLAPKALGIVHDGSLHGMGIEFPTPVLSGLIGENFIKDFCTLLQKKDFKVDSTCGLHIHLDAGRKFFTRDVRYNRIEPIRLKNLILFYYFFDRVFLSMLPRSRTGNTYCDEVSNRYRLDEILECKTLEDFEALWYKEPSKERRTKAKQEHYHSSRYTGANFHCLLSSGHFEIRYHSGTINHEKILNWLAIHIRVMDLIADNKITINQIMKCKEINNINPLTNYMIKLLGFNFGSRKKIGQYIKYRQSLFINNDNNEEN